MWVWIETSHLFSWKFDFLRSPELWSQESRKGNSLHSVTRLCVNFEGRDFQCPTEAREPVSPLEADETFVTGCTFLPKEVTIYIAPKWFLERKHCKLSNCNSRRAGTICLVVRRSHKVILHSPKGDVCLPTWSFSIPGIAALPKVK